MSAVPLQTETSMADPDTRQWMPEKQLMQQAGQPGTTTDDLQNPTNPQKEEGAINVALIVLFMLILTTCVVLAYFGFRHLQQTFSNAVLEISIGIDEIANLGADVLVELAKLLSKLFDTLDFLAIQLNTALQKLITKVSAIIKKLVAAVMKIANPFANALTAIYHFFSQQLTSWWAQSIAKVFSSIVDAINTVLKFIGFSPINI